MKPGASLNVQLDTTSTAQNTWGARVSRAQKIAAIALAIPFAWNVATRSIWIPQAPAARPPAPMVSLGRKERMSSAVFASPAHPPATCATQGPNVRSAKTSTP